MKKNVLVSGGAGFIGSHLVERLLLEGCSVRVLDNFSSGSRDNLASVADRIEIVEGDIRDPQVVATAVRGCDWIFHLAALVSVPESFRLREECGQINADATAGLLQAAATAGASRFVLASTCAVYGDARTLPLSETAPTAPQSPYAETKLIAEGHCRRMAQETSLRTAAVRFFNVYGPRQRADSAYSGVIAKFIDCARQGKPPLFHGDGTQTRDFIHVRDIVELLVRCARGTPEADAFSSGLILNAGTGRETSLLQLWAILAEAAGVALPPSHGPVREGDIPHSLADIRQASRLLGWKPERLVKDGLVSLLGEQGDRR